MPLLVTLTRLGPYVRVRRYRHGRLASGFDLAAADAHSEPFGAWLEALFTLPGPGTATSPACPREPPPRGRPWP